MRQSTLPPDTASGKENARAASAAASPDSDAPPMPRFVAQARRRAFWSRPARALLWLGSLLLLLALALQMALSYRDWLAARYPQLAPTLQALCAPLSCRVQPYRQRDAVVIDGQAFRRVSSGNFRLSVTLRNTADVPVASPALELTLLNVNGEAVARRVVTAEELGAPPALAARGEFSGVSALTVSNLPDPDVITGYLMGVFYP
jgi:hypothetical protein